MLTDLGLQTKLNELVEHYQAETDAALVRNKALIAIYSQLSAKEILDLIESGIFFLVANEQGLVYAVRYLAEYIVRYKGAEFRFPPCFLQTPVDADLNFSDVTVRAIVGGNYKHMFVYSGNERGHGQKVCLGSWNGSSAARQASKLPFAARLRYMMDKTEQILRSGYSESVHVAPVHNITNFEGNRVK